MDKNYYMIITTKEDYKKDLENNFKFLGFPARNKKSVEKFNIGDKVVFYVTKISSFAATVEITGESFYSTKQVWTDEYDVWPYRVESQKEYAISEEEKMIYIKDIWDNLEFIKNKQKWGSQVQGSFRKISEHDYKVILKSIKEKCDE